MADERIASPGRSWDCLVIGAGPAGLAAATYLARFRRRVCVLHHGQSRAGYIAKSHNVPGFPDGISGDELLSRMHLQAQEHGATVEFCKVDALDATADGFAAQAGDTRLRARTVLLATGTADHVPLDGLDKRATLQGLVRWCPLCDGYETLDTRVVLLGEPRHGPAHARFLRTYTRQLSLVVPPELGRLSARQRRQLAALDIAVLERKPVRVSFGAGGGQLWFADGAALAFDSLYPMTGGHAHSSLATALGARSTRDGALRLDANRRTTVPGLYAAGDVVASLKQIAVAVAEGAVAATAIHHALPYRPR